MDNVQKVSIYRPWIGSSVYKYSGQIRFAENLNEELPDVCLGILFEFFPFPRAASSFKASRKWRRDTQVPSTKLLGAISPNVNLFMQSKGMTLAMQQGDPFKMNSCEATGYRIVRRVEQLTSEVYPYHLNSKLLYCRVLPGNATACGFRI
jgi:hypothetical protein